MPDTLNTPLFPKSRIADFDADDQYEVTDATISDIAEEAVQDFFRTVADRLNDLYAGSTTTGDFSPLYDHQITATATDWVNRMAQNNSAVIDHEEEWCVLEGLEAMDVEALFHDPLPEGLAVIEVGSFMGGVMAITLRGTRRSIYDFVQTHWDWDLLVDVDEGFGPECIVPDIATTPEDEAGIPPAGKAPLASRWPHPYRDKEQT